MLYNLALIFLLAICHPVISKSFKRHHDVNQHEIPELRWLFEMEDNNGDSESEVDNKVCETHECKLIAKEFMKGMDKSVDPCDNFYSYVCGSYDEKEPIPEYAPSWGRFELFQQTVFHRIKQILETKPEPEDILPVRQAKKWYHSCMDTESLEKKGLKPIESILMQTGGWPMIMESAEWNDDQSWQEIERHYARLTGKNIFYDITYTYENDAQYTFTSGSLPLAMQLPKDVRNFDDDDYDNYKLLVNAVAKMFILFNKGDISDEKLQKDVEDLVELEKELDKIMNSDEGKSMTIDHFMNQYEEDLENYEDKCGENEQMCSIDRIDYKNIMREIFSAINHKISGSDKIYIQTPTYFTNLTLLLNKTPKRAIINYIHWHFVSKMIAYTTDDIREAIFMLREDTLGVEAREPRWLECTKEMKMTAASAYAFVQKFYSDETDKAVREMLDNIREEMEFQIDKTHWMNDETKELAKNKLNNITVFLGYPTWYKNRTAVVNSYKGLPIGFNYFDNVLSYEKFEYKKKLRHILKPSENKLDPEVDPLLVNAMYSSENTIELPAADFQPPLFTKDLPKSVNYGVTGTVIGHEIGHAYDSQGIKVNLNGTRISKQMLDSYFKRAECFLDQFNNYYGVTEAPSETTPYEWNGSKGRKTRGENIADTTGLHSVYEAYHKMMQKRSSKDTKLPGFEEYTDDQMFFISFAALWCGNEREEYKAKMERMDNHSPRNLRVIGSLSNTNDFARAFNCPLDSPMNPENKCNIWERGEKKKSHKPTEKKNKKHHRRARF